MSVRKQKVSLETIASLCKRRGFIFQGSEIYGGINGFWDYGPIGCELKRNIRESWWRTMVLLRDDVVGLDSAIIMHPRTWEASGHLSGFADPMVDCRACKRRFKADQLCEEQEKKLIIEYDSDGKTVKRYTLPEGIKCPVCGATALTEPRAFNLMFKTFVGPVEDESAVTYLRPETAQGIFCQYANILAISRLSIPFGIAQIGKAFRNEINPRNYTFRSREFEQMEMEFFIKPDTDKEWHDYWVKARMEWYTTIGLPLESLKIHTYTKNELAHYASACVDILYEFPFGFQELEGIAARSNFDLMMHQTYSGKSMEYFDQQTKEKYIPHVIEPSAGVDRIALALICEAYCEEWVPRTVKDGLPAEPIEAEHGKKPPEGFESRTVLKFHPRVAPIKVGVFPLLKNKPELVETARHIYQDLRTKWNCFYDDAGAIGRRYRRLDEIGTPYCITVDFQTLSDSTVTLRDRDSMKQERIKVSELADQLDKLLR